LKAIAHRGPDFSAQEEYHVANSWVMLGHRRLSILDLTADANQPFTNTEKTFSLIFNGEIYNHAALRDYLKGKGVRFQTRSDTEVLFHGLVFEGADFIKKLNGMFSFSFLNKKNKTLLLARDPFGIKPLYLMRKSHGELIFGSEIRSLSILNGNPLEPDPNLIAEFLLNGFLYEPNSGYKNVEKIPPGCWLQVNLENFVETRERYYDVEGSYKIGSSFGEMLEEQVNLELEADVSTGIFFSGGLDSAVVGAAASRSVDALFVDYGGSDSQDGIYVSQIADALNLPLARISNDANTHSVYSTLESFRQVATGTEEPISDFTYMATKDLSRHAREVGFKVMLSGMGGDELFGGYPRYRLAQRWQFLSAAGLPLSALSSALNIMPSWSKRSARLRSFLRASSFEEAYTNLVGYFSVDEVTKLLGDRKDCADFFVRMRSLLEPVNHLSYFRQAQYLDRHGFLPHNLTVTDRASMSESIEVRVPMLNPQLDRYAAKLDYNDLIFRSAGKMPLRRYLHNQMPASLINRPKVAFNPPLDGRINLLGRDICLELVSEGKISNYLDTCPARSWVNDHFDGRANHSYRIWQLIYFNFWLDN
jgi:asparagine synthase (glutamine-hydrolysing)